jgi:hypothetical protein
MLSAQRRSFRDSFVTALTGAAATALRTVSLAGCPASEYGRERSRRRSNSAPPRGGNGGQIETTNVTGAATAENDGFNLVFALDLTPLFQRLIR